MERKLKQSEKELTGRHKEELSKKDSDYKTLIDNLEKEKKKNNQFM